MFLVTLSSGNNRAETSREEQRMGNWGEERAIEVTSPLWFSVLSFFSMSNVSWYLLIMTGLPHSSSKPPTPSRASAPSFPAATCNTIKVLV